MTATISWSTPQNAESWEPTGGVMVSPFNMEAILRACPALLAEWQRTPFILSKGYDGRLEIKLWTADLDGGG